MSDSKNIIQVLMDASQSMAIRENEINRVIVTIIKSCGTRGTRGADHKSLLLAKIEGLKRLAVLYKSTAKKYENAMLKLVGGVSEDKVVAELYPYNVFLNDQLKSEKECYVQVLSLLRA